MIRVKLASYSICASQLSVKIVDKSVVKWSIDCVLGTPFWGLEKEAELVKAIPPKIHLVRGQKVVMSRRCCIIILIIKKRRRDSRGKAVGRNVGTSFNTFTIGGVKEAEVKGSYQRPVPGISIPANGLGKQVNQSCWNLIRRHYITQQLLIVLPSEIQAWVWHRKRMTSSAWGRLISRWLFASWETCGLT